uniref:Uncharacterized protein n=1 Tax=Anguilla anguilla TaxID=7936 RepID=A0A0E9U2C0_ANGAN
MKKQTQIQVHTRTQRHRDAHKPTNTHKHTYRHTPVMIFSSLAVVLTE